MAQRRQQGPPPVVAFLPLSKDVDFPALWRLVLSAFAAGTAGKAVQPKKKGGAEDMEADKPSTSGISPTFSAWTTSTVSQYWLPMRACSFDASRSMQLPGLSPLPSICRSSALYIYSVR